MLLQQRGFHSIGDVTAGEVSQQRGVSYQRGLTAERGLRAHGLLQQRGFHSIGDLTAEEVSQQRGISQQTGTTAEVSQQTWSGFSWLNFPVFNPNPQGLCPSLSDPGEVHQISIRKRLD